MYWAVPIMWPSRVWRTVPRQRATPKSITFTQPLLRQHQVRRLDVAVDHAGRVRVPDALERLQQERHRARDRQRPRVEQLAEGAALDVLHHHRQRSPSRIMQ